eukprot:3557903-Amphidinium_carterae.1
MPPTSGALRAAQLTSGKGLLGLPLEGASLGLARLATQISDHVQHKIELENQRTDPPMDSGESPSPGWTQPQWSHTARAGGSF